MRTGSLKPAMTGEMPDSGRHFKKVSKSVELCRLKETLADP